LVYEDGGLEVFFEGLKTALEMRVERSSRIDLFAGVVASFEKLEVARYAATFLVIKFASALVADPGVGTATTGVDPEDVFETEVLAKCDIDYFYSHGNETPAFVANGGASAAGSDVIVVCHIDIED
jgi:hypothetical protein